MLKNFLKGFNKEAGQVHDLLSEVKIVLLLEALQPGPLNHSLAKTSSKILNEFKLHVEKYLNLKDVEASKAKTYIKELCLTRRLSKGNQRNNKIER